MILRQVITESLTLLFLCCSLFTSAQRGQSNVTKPNLMHYQQKDTTLWVVNFGVLRSALYRNERSNVKMFIDFPMATDDNEIWYLASSETNEFYQKHKQTSFSEKDFDKHFGNIFPNMFIKCFLRIKMTDLYKTGKSESPEISDSKTSYKLYATYDQAKRVLDLNYATNTPIKVSGTEYDPAESNVIYRFHVSKSGHIKLVRVLLAG